MPKYKLTNHAKQRAHDRLALNSKKARKRFTDIIHTGYSLNDFEGEFLTFLIHKHLAKNSKQIGIKVKDTTIVIYNRASNSIITTYLVPEEFRPISKFFKNKYKEYPKKEKKVPELSTELLTKLKNLFDKSMSFELDTLIKEKDKITVGLRINEVFENYGVGSTELEANNDALTKCIIKYEKGVETHEKY